MQFLSLSEQLTRISQCLLYWFFVNDTQSSLWHCHRGKRARINQIPIQIVSLMPFEGEELEPCPVGACCIFMYPLYQLCLIFLKLKISWISWRESVSKNTVIWNWIVPATRKYIKLLYNKVIFRWVILRCLGFAPFRINFSRFMTSKTDFYISSLSVSSGFSLVNDLFSKRSVLPLYSYSIISWSWT